MTYRIDVTFFIVAGSEEEARSTLIDNAETYLNDALFEVEEDKS